MTYTCVKTVQFQAYQIGNGHEAIDEDTSGGRSCQERRRDGRPDVFQIHPWTLQYGARENHVPPRPCFSNFTRYHQLRRLYMKSKVQAFLSKYLDDAGDYHLKALEAVKEMTEKKVQHYMNRVADTANPASSTYPLLAHEQQFLAQCHPLSASRTGF